MIPPLNLEASREALGYHSKETGYNRGGSMMNAFVKSHETLPMGSKHQLK